MDVRPSKSRNANTNSKREQTQDILQTQSVSKEHNIVIQRHRSRPVTFLHAVLIVLLCPYIIASIQDALLFGSGSDDVWAIQSSRSAILFGGVHAMALPQSQSTSAKRHQSVFDVERTGSTSANVTRVNGTEASVGHNHTQSQQSQQSVEAVDVPSKRWGHSVTYLEKANVALFVGGQVSSHNNSMVLTNDVFAMDLSANSTQTWVKLSSDNLPPHAFAGRAVTHDEEGSDERVFIVGGATNDCSSNATQVSMWKAGKDKNWKEGQWSTPALSEGAIVPERRRGARAIQVPVEMSMQDDEARLAKKAGGVAFMVLGGSSDETTCNNVSSITSDVGVWTLVAGEARRARNSSAAFDTRTLVLSAEMANISVAEYSSIYLPPNGTHGDRLMLLGGVDKEGNLTSFEHLWVLDIASGLWSPMSTTNSTHNGIPHGRVGHTATRMENGAVIVYGGYTSLAGGGVPTSDVHVLNYTVSPAVWSRVNSSSAPKRAFHTAFMAGQVMVVGFGKGEYNSSSSSSNHTSKKHSSRSMSHSSQGAVQFLDTSSTNWTWSDSMAAVLAAREPKASSSVESSTSQTASATSTAAASSTPASQSTASTKKAAATSSAVMASPAATSTVAPSSVETTAAQPSPSSSTDEPTSTDNSSKTTSSTSTPISWPTSTSPSNSSGITPEKRNTAVIASVLGAAAIAASMAGLYAAHKRREARLNGDHYSMSGDKYEHFSSSAPGPPVSSLWLHQLKRRATLASDAVMARGRSFKRGSNSPNSGPASAGNSPPSMFASYSAPANDTGFQVIRNMPPTSRLSMRRSEMLEQEATRERLYMQENRQGVGLPDSFLRSILDDEDMYNQDDMGRKLIVPPPAAYNTRALSSESLESDGGLSHFSYPYLSAMHRLSVAAGSPSTNGSPSGSSPRYSPDGKTGYNNFAMTPTWSPSPETMGVIAEKRSSFESMDSDPEFENMRKSPSAMMVAAACVSSPFFPRDEAPQSPTMPNKAYIESANQTQRKNQLRVMNDADL